MSQDGEPHIENKQPLTTPEPCMGIVQDYVSDEISKIVAVKSIFTAFFESADYDHTPSDNIDAAIATYVAMLNQCNNTQVHAAVCGEISGGFREQEDLEVEDHSQFSKRPCFVSPTCRTSTKKCAPDESLFTWAAGDDADGFFLTQSQELIWKLVQNHLLDIKSTKCMVLGVK